MLRATWRRLGSPAWMAIALLTLVPALAEAQLFPNRTIRRERPTPAAESPYVGQIRRDYFGYFPTCWQRFPAGWQCPCPNPERPNADLSFQQIKFNEKRKVDEEPLPGDDNDSPMPPTDRGGNQPPDSNLPPVPETGNSPFLMDTPRAPANPPSNPGQGAPDPSRPPLGRANPATRAGAPSGLMEMPELPATSPTTGATSNLMPGSMELAPEATLASNNAPSRPDLGPLPSAPTPAPFAPTSAGSMAPVDAEPIANMPAPAPAQAPRRRGLLGSLFGRGNTQNR